MKTGTVAVTIAIALFFFSPLAVAQEEAVAREEAEKGTTLADLVAEDTFLYLTIPSLSRSWKGFKTLPIYEVYKDEEVSSLLDSLGENMDEILPGIRIDLVDDLLRLPEIFDGEVSFAFRHPDEEESWALSLVSRSDPAKATVFAEETLHNFLHSLFAFGPETVTIKGRKVKRYMGPRDFLFMADLDGRILLTPEEEQMATMISRLDKPGPSLAGLEAFREAAQRMKAADSSFFVFLSLEPLWKKALDEMDTKEQAIFSELGFQGLRSLSANLTLAGGRAEDTIWLDIPGERKGLLKVLANAHLDSDLARLAPNNTLLLGAGVLNIPDLYKTVLRASEASDYTLFDDLRSGMDNLAKKLGLRAFSDLLSQLGTEAVTFVALPKGGGIIPEAAAAIEVLEPDQLQTNLFALARTAAGEEPKSASYRDREIYYLGEQRRGPLEIGLLCWTVTDGYLFVSHHPSILKGIIRRLDQNRGSLKEDEDFLAAWDKLPGEAVAVAYVNSKRLFEYVYSVFVFFATMAGDNLPFDAALLPTAEAISDYLTFGLSGVTAEEKGILIRTESDGYGPTALFLYGSSVAAFFLPFEIWDDSLDRFPACGWSQRQLGKGLEEYRQNHQTYPPSLEALWEENVNRHATCPQARMDREGAADDEFPPDFGYVVETLAIEPPEFFPDDWMILWDSEPRHNDGRVILLGNDEQLWLPEQAFQERLKEQKK